MLKIAQLSKTIRHKTILNDVNVGIDHGKIGIFLGGSGVGKSTLLRVLNHLESYDSGQLTLDGAPLDQKDVGMVFQHFNLFENLNVEDNIISTLIHCKGMDKKDAKKISDHLLARYGLEEHAKAQISHLSGGQKQRLAIARTLAVDPKIICLDEPTSALDPKLTAQVAKFITELAAENRIVILTTHDMHLLEQLEGHLYLMEKGTIIESACTNSFHLYPNLQKFLSGI